jgi:hypothetical protein
MTATDGFRRILAPRPEPAQPVLLRGVFYDPLGPGIRTRLMDPRDALNSYPRLVLYGGPSYYSAFQTAAGRKFLRDLNDWAIHAYKKHLATQLMPIAPSRVPTHEPPWPHTEWRWWFLHETSPQPRYQIAQITPTYYAWRLVPFEPHHTI